jgi:glycosyltransferase involved in cell wall biosynthesis
MKASDPRPRRRVLRVHHGAVVAAWRARERHLRELGFEILLVTAQRWDEGGRVVRCEPLPGEDVVPIRTFGSHPALFIYDPRALWGLLRRCRWDLLDVHEEPYSLAAAELRMFRRLCSPRAPLLLYTAQNIAKRYPLPVRVLERLALRDAAGIYACSQGAADVIRTKGYEGDLRVVPLGVELERFNPRAPIPATVSPFRVGYVGRLLPQKGVVVLLETVAKEPDWHLDVVGAGPDGPRLRERADALGLQDRVRFRGAVPHEDLPGVYRSFDAVCIPSLRTPRWVEQFCRVAVEAMASGVPVVASDDGSLPDVVGDAGLLVPPGDAAALHAALTRVASNGELRTSLAARGLERSRRYSWAEVARQHAELYRKVLT